MNPLELRPQVENEPVVTSRVLLDFMRHGKREKDPDPALDGGPSARLTAEGRAQVDAKGRELGAQTEVALGWGSPRIRTQETGYRAMLAGKGIEPDDTLEKIEERVAQGKEETFEEEGVRGLGTFGKKMIASPLLDFHDKGPIAEEGVAAYRAGNYMGWVIQESDASARAKKDQGSSTYTRIAGNVAEIILRYTKVGTNFNRIASHKDIYKEFGNQLERYLGTHMGISESFVAKVLEETRGMGIRDAFLQSVGGGFSETEGVRIEIVNKGTEQTIIMRYAVKDPTGGSNREEQVEIGKDILEKIIAERDLFDKEITDSIEV